MSKSSYEFWFLNNGITIVCDQFDPMTDPDNPDVKLNDLQIVDGCQTATKFALAQRGSRLSHDVWVITRIYETTDPMLFSPVLLTTNNQNQSKSRDSRANDLVQLDSDDWFFTAQPSRLSSLNCRAEY